MGGVIALTLRFKDGMEHRMERWTNILPENIHNPQFWNGDPKVWDESLRHFYQELNKGKKGETIITSWEMAKHPYLAPSEYGILVIDYKTMTIVDCQGYLDTTTVMSMTPYYPKLKKAGLVGKCVWEDKACDEEKHLHQMFEPMKVYEVKPGPWTVFKTKSFADARKKILELGFILTPDEEKIWKKVIRQRRSP